MKIIVAITGASGIILGAKTVEALARQKHEVHLIISDAARKVGEYEGMQPLEKAEKLAHTTYNEKDIAAKLASSSNIMDAVIVVPCSMKTLSAIANGFADNLIARSCENALKMNWPLIIVPRDTPLSLPAIENMRKIKEAGGIILPPTISYYHKPEKITDLEDFIVGKILDSLRIDHKLYKRWQ